ncbi:DUF2577 domain-containing protein [Saccharibacillus sp. JS10]|uniref:DUF2577 domain-containing protein n=1 Tax=Saccharibacillus sp. JS10 TaxID=2950552 RepID=UPI0021097446|nr:DUF2577 domain-containing protein [Saccharibacillus sp. JS10]MCQ4086680.1 DUF2577 domain-containing protein [Saccharibacillus sp. JS10]
MTKDPYGQFADMMSSAMKGHTRQMASGLGGVLGTMTASGVKLDDFKHEMQDYWVAALPGTLQTDASSGGSESSQSAIAADGSESGDPSSGESTVTLNVDGFKPGDRVLAIRVNGGNDVVVLCKVVGADG